MASKDNAIIQQEDKLKAYAAQSKDAPAPVTQIYALVNDIISEIAGETAPKVIDTNSFVSMGSTVIDNNLVERYNNSLLKRIARTIIVDRKYRTKFRVMSLTDFEYGAIVQKITIDMPDAIPDMSWALVNGQSIDQYIINKVDYQAKYFEAETPYSFMITLSTFLLKTAFTAESVMAAFISAIYNKVQMALDMALEGLAKNAVANAMVNLGTNQVYNLVTRYNELRGATLTAATAQFDGDFLRWMSGFIDGISRKMEENTVLYNTSGLRKFTPKNLQRFYTVIDFYEQMRTTAWANTRHNDFISLNPDMTVSGWQSPQAPMSINATNKTGAEISMTNVVGILHDRDAIGTYLRQEEVLTTPVNARGRYYNTFWHGNQMYINDLDENIVAFTLN